ncbi:NAD(P)-dependent oxidoreductase [Spirosoma endbachense]|uniref:NAD(P)H-binding protein n=1 Tax=Spirosoma endbachense TaxID=2666025 RepID=A0A6P1VUN1_9BACT|nr:NAD(P)H-binding protein [Spirosoma endbachense]QHV95670.1 NAD(P)H-binding protein [Spirosoma endbachense]
MQITILGSTGQVGKVVMAQALKSGYQIKVLVRDPEKLGYLKEKVHVVAGNLLDEASVEKSLTGSVAVINVSGAVKEPDQLKKFKKIGDVLVSKMKQQGIKRLINISLAVIQLPQEKLDFKRKAIRVLVNLFFKEKKLVNEAIMAAVLEEKDLEWTFVRPAFFSTKPGSGVVLADDTKMQGTTIMLEDLAMFLVQQITSTEWMKKAPLVSSGTK